jgi:hypothetical protein
MKPARDPNIYAYTYWSHKGKYPAAKTALYKLIPNFGEVTAAGINPALEKFRVASNCYYDLYNNGLCNLADEFLEVFGFVPGSHDELTKETVNQAERVMDRLIVKAAKEQGIPLT